VQDQARLARAEQLVAELKRAPEEALLMTKIGLICFLVVAPGISALAGQRGSAPAQVERISVDELILMLAKRRPVAIIDVRSRSSYESSDRKIKGAIRIPLDELEKRIKEIPRAGQIVTYCA
jgi:hypothetical protein